MTRAAAPCFFLLLVSLTCGCHYGMTASKYRPAQGPQGVIMQVTTTRGDSSGELIEVRDSGIVLLSDRKLRLLPYSDILSARADQTSSSYSLSKQQAPQPKVKEHLRLLSRFPQGLTPELLSRLLAAHGQSELIGSAP